MASSKNRHVRLSSRVADSGKEALISCSRCLKRGLVCTMSSSSRRCSACIRSGRMCHRELHSDFEWDQLEKQENETNKQIDSVISERSDIQSRLAHLQSQLAIAQAELAVVDNKFDQLNKKKKVLKDRGTRLLSHDSELLAEQDLENPPNPPSPAELTASWDVLQSLDPSSLEFLDQSVRHQELVASLEIASSTQGNLSSQ
jgi:predicted nuclease with TOPRIM domain